MTLTYFSLFVPDPCKCKNLGQREVGSNDRVKINGRTDTADFNTLPTNAVDKRPRNINGNYGLGSQNNSAFDPVSIVAHSFTVGL